MTFSLPRLVAGPGARRLFAAALAGMLCATGASQKPVAPQVLTSPEGITEVGLLDGAAYRIDIPVEWNHSLIVYYHGYAESPVTFHIAEKLAGQQQPMFERHYAVAQSAYSDTGWALAQAYPETEALRRYFSKKYGQPRETYAVGGSMGGDLVSITMELNPKPYLGGLDLCGAVGPTSQSFNRRFAWRAAFDHYFPGVQPALVPAPADYESSPAARDRILTALRANPAAAAEMRSLTGEHTDRDLAAVMDYFTFVVADLQRRAKGNPFDNRNYLYVGTTPGSSQSDFDLNDKVQRYAANPQSREYLIRHYTPNGHLGRPMLALHTLYDQLVPPDSLALYAHEVETAGAAQNLVQQYVHREGHCNFTEDDIGRAFDELVDWTHGGARPTPGWLH